eukprot:2826561-Prymnesium_polylepis.1
MENGGRLLLRVCLHPGSPRSDMCEAWGETWQQYGADIREAFGSSGCDEYDVRALARWWKNTRSNPAVPPIAALAGLIALKPGTRSDQHISDLRTLIATYAAN